MAGKGKDYKGRNLKTGEYQRKDWMYRYKYVDSTGKNRVIYSKDLAQLRIKEEQVKQDLKDGIKTKAKNTLTVNDMFDKYIATKTELKDTIRNNYNYMYDNYARKSFGMKKLVLTKCNSTIDVFFQMTL